MLYRIQYQNPESRYVQVTFQITGIHQELIHLQLPSWRPGRYELQNYARNIRGFAIETAAGDPVPFVKITKDRWEVNTKGCAEINVKYEYYANQPDAGASYLTNDLLYLNPVNLLLYVVGREDETVEVQFTLPKEYEIATQLKKIAPHGLQAKGFDYLADSPLFASASLQHHVFQVEEATVHFWFYGKHPFDLQRLEDDTRTYAKAQKTLFGDLPSSEYHFLYLMLDHPFRHGVEHLDSTVIAMGQMPDNTDEEYYHDLLAISSHEFFHLWNVKRIRPADMLPYDFTRENYSTLGYIYEGITTYYGDLVLWRSGVWSEAQYLQSLSADLTRHLTNEGRHFYSVAESSWDTWLDGYTPGVPGRKVSIYMEGLVAALIADVELIKATKGKARLDAVMRELYQASKHGTGYTEASYREILERVSGQSYAGYFKDVIWGRGKMEHILKQTLTDLGLILHETESGFKLSRNPAATSEQVERFNVWSSANFVYSEHPINKSA